MDCLEAIFRRRSVRKYRAEPVAEEHLAQILEAGRQAPSGGNRQPWHFVVVRDPELRRRTGEACSGQTWVGEADVIICACGDSTISEKWNEVDPTIALQNMILAATALGYGTCWVGAFDREKVHEVLQIPEHLNVVCLTPVGVPDEAPEARPRKPAEEIFSRDQFGNPWV